MAVVLDASAIIPLAMEDEDATVAEVVVRRVQAEGGIVPALFWYEIRNVLLSFRTEEPFYHWAALGFSKNG